MLKMLWKLCQTHVLVQSVVRPFDSDCRPPTRRSRRRRNNVVECTFLRKSHRLAFNVPKQRIDTTLHYKSAISRTLLLSPESASQLVVGLIKGNNLSLSVLMRSNAIYRQLVPGMHACAEPEFTFELTAIHHIVSQPASPDSVPSAVMCTRHHRNINCTELLLNVFTRCFIRRHAHFFRGQFDCLPARWTHDVQLTERGNYLRTCPFVGDQWNCIDCGLAGPPVSLPSGSLIGFESQGSQLDFDTCAFAGG